MADLVLVKFTASQSSRFDFPVGCPVWHMPRVPCEEGGFTIIKGTVDEVYFHPTRKMLYRVVHKDESIGDLLPENELVYASQCPVTVALPTDGGQDDKSVDAVVLQAKKSETGEVVYTVMYSVDGSYSAYREGIEAGRIKYRHCAATSEGAQSTSYQDQKVAVAQNDEGQIAASTNEEHSKPPVTEVTCEPFADESLDNRSRMTSPEQGSKHAVAEQSHEGATKGCNNLGTTPAASSVESSRLRRFESMESPSGEASFLNKRAKLNTSFEITLPLWLQKDRESWLLLYSHLYGPSNNPHYKRLRKEANCNMIVHKNTESNNQPMTISIAHLNDNTSEANKHFTVARKMIQDILLQFNLPGLPPIDKDGSRGRLLYEIMKSFGKGNNPRQSTSHAVTQLHPFAKDPKYHCMSVVELPSQFTVKGRSYHGDYLKSKSMLKKIRTTNCSIYLCGDEFNFPVRYGEPHAIIVGNASDWRSVDRAVNIVKDGIHCHQKSCGCFLAGNE